MSKDRFPKHRQLQVGRQLLATTYACSLSLMCIHCLVIFIEQKHTKGRKSKSKKPKNLKKKQRRGIIYVVETTRSLWEGLSNHS